VGGRHLRLTPKGRDGTVADVETQPDDLVAWVLADVAAREPVDERERASIAEVLSTVPRLARPFDKDADPVHITGSGLIVGQRGIVLLRHRRLGIWVQPGGHVDAGETPWDAARRESAEETGLTMRFLEEAPELAHVDVHPGGRGHTHLDLRYLLTVDGDDDPAPPPDESQDVGWFGWDEAPGVAEPYMQGILIALADRFAEIGNPNLRS
jgi:8-oxo-dGTP pyrophosphatase MutT (NUDIX family)